MLDQYLREIRYLKVNMIVIVMAIAASYSVYHFYDVETVSSLGEEDHFFEWMTFFCLFAAFFICLVLFIKTKNIFFMLLSVLFLFGGGEEISWGQRIVGFKTPEIIDEYNVQSEFNIHNLEVFDHTDIHYHLKTRFLRLLEINFLFRLFIMLYGIVLPFLVYHIKYIGVFAYKIKLPIPPISIGIFFFINWFVFWILHTFIISSTDGKQYMDTAGEIFECLSAFILLVISIYFYLSRGEMAIGKDIKEYL